MLELEIPIKVTKEVFRLIESAETIDDISIEVFRKKSKLIKENLKKDFDRKLYRKIDFYITKKEIDQLKSENILTKESDGKYYINFKSEDPLTKLLYSLAWKQGDLLKIRQIVNGICSDDEYLKKDKSIVFKQFGKYLSSDNQPIVDQHVVRAFAFRNEPKEDNLKFVISNSPTENQLKIANHYIEYINGLKVSKDNKSRELFTNIDEVLFLLGKFLKEWKG